ncbi:MAG: nucleoside triphosphate pyrophosphohydrolase [Kiloniellales bacterium]|nr:nucleoside triphosphate pyrophosphohydrolase [Kiloniellales bacterium]
MSDESTRAEAQTRRLLEIMAKLRHPEHGCPWDIEQNFRSIAPYTIEEAYEVAAAIEAEDMGELRDELGDLLLQVVFHARMAEEAGAFDFAQVATAISDKMERRHPHVFGDTEVGGAAAQTRAWEEHKARERAAKGDGQSVLSGVALALPALMRAEKLQKRAARVGFDWPEAAQVFAKIEEEVSELKEEMTCGGDRDRLEDEIGDLFFALVNLARHLTIDPEVAMRRCNAKFERRFRAIETTLAAQGRNPKDVSLDELEDLWQAAKATEG